MVKQTWGLDNKLEEREENNSCQIKIAQPQRRKIRHKANKTEPSHDKIYNKTGVTIKDLDQHVRPYSMTRDLVYPSLDSPETVKVTISDVSDQTARMRRLVWVFGGRTSLTVGVVVC